jgi:serine/threonine protein kinase
MDAMQPIELAARAVNKHVDQEENYRLEIAFQKIFYGHFPKVTWPIWHDCDYSKSTSVEGGHVISNKLSVVSPLADGNLQTYLKTADLKGCLEAIRQLSQSLVYLHKNDFIHGDLKNQNVLYKINNENLVVSLIDFGFTFKDDGEQQTLPGFFSRGFYGSQLPTAPEFLLNTAFSGDYKKLEAWALGCMLLEGLSGHRLPWQKALMDLIQVCKADLVNAAQRDLLKQEIVNCMALSISLSRDRFLQGRPRESFEPKDRLYVLILDLLIYDPELRLTIPQFLDEILKLQKL